MTVIPQDPKRVNENLTDKAEFIPAPQVSARYGISDMSLWRWLKDPELDFPQPLRINTRRYWRLADLEAWEASRMDGAA